MRLKRFLLPTLLSLGLLAATAALAAGDFGLGTAAKGAGLPTGSSLPSLIGTVLKAVLGFVATLFLILMVYAGFLYMTARGDEKKVGEAKKMIVGAIVGVVIIASAYAVTSFVLNAVTSSTSQSGTAGSSPTPVTGTGDSQAPPGSSSCPNITCHSGSDCTASQNSCYTGTCICIGEGDPPTGGTSPCSVGYCDTVVQP